MESSFHETLVKINERPTSGDAGGRVSPLFAIWGKTQKSIYQHKKGSLAYEERGGSFVVAGDPWVYAGGNGADLWLDFRSWAHQQNRSVCGYYFRDLPDILVTRPELANSFEVFPLGHELSLDLINFDLATSSAREVRRGLRSGIRKNLNILEISHHQKIHWIDKILAMREGWLAKKRREINYLLSSPKEGYLGADKERWFVALKGSQPVAFVSATPYRDQQKVSIYLDHMIYSADHAKGGMDLLLSECILIFKREGFFHFNMGLCPFQGQSFKSFGQARESLKLWQPQAMKSSLRRLCVGQGIHTLATFPFLIPSKGLYDYKKKYCSHEKSTYLLLDSKYSLVRQAKDLLLATYGS